MSEKVFKMFIISEFDRYVHSSIFSSIVYEMTSRDELFNQGGKSHFPPPGFADHYIGSLNAVRLRNLP